MPIWNIFSNEKKKLQAKRSRVRQLARQRYVSLSDEQLDLMDLILLDAILDAGYFTDEAAEQLGIELPDVANGNDEPVFEQSVAAAYNEVREIADTTESVEDEDEDDVPEDVTPEPVRRIPDPEPASTPDPEPTTRSYGESDYSSSDSSSSYGGDSGGGSSLD